MTGEPLRSRVTARGITRLCHVTRSMTLPFILEMGEIVATSRLDQDERAIYYPNDELRLDGHRTHVSCSVQYPNAWYLRSIRAREPLFKDWMILMLEPDPLWWQETLFSPVNAAAEGGRHIAGGAAAFDAMFAPFPPASRFSRGLTHLLSCPTDNQAEILVHDGIRLDLIQCVVVQDDAQARRERWRVEQSGLATPGLGLAVCPGFFDAEELARRITSGIETDPECEPF